MLPCQFPRPARLGLYALACLILLALCLWPTQNLPDAPGGDRLHHVAAWFILTVTGYALAPRRVLAIPTFAVAFGALVELAQGAVPTGRHMDLADFAADGFGVALGVLAFLAIRRMTPRWIGTS
jgi:VanZ family protein